MADVLANVIVALIVLWSSLVILRRFMPRTVNYFQQGLAQYATSHGWIWLADRLQPKRQNSSCGGCSSCGDNAKDGCSTTSADMSHEAQPVQWRTNKPSSH